MTAIEQLDIDLPIELFDEAEGEVLIFSDLTAFEEFQESERSGVDFDLSSVRRRAITLLDEMQTVMFELQKLTAAV